jgi:ADP-ribose pyrophosphatase YjhB (NUDIX family)
MQKAGQKRLSEKEWRLVQRRVPIACVDVLPIKKGEAGNFKVGLIYRDTPHQGRRWSLIGGRLFRNEPLRSAVIRQIREVLGKQARCILVQRVQPLFVAEYFSQPIKALLFDPRKHAIGLTFAVQVRGTFKPGGEALKFRWFNRQQLPDSGIFAFGQRKVVSECIRRLEDRKVRDLKRRT